MGAVATFVYANWIASYPEFSAVSEPQAAAFFSEATLYLRNDGTSPVCDTGNQTTLLYMITAHIAAQRVQSAGSPNPGAPQDANTPVGRITSASEGSVSVSTENSYPPGSAQWYQTTKYGSAYWQATNAFRRMRYRAHPTVVVNSVYPFGRG